MHILNIIVLFLVYSLTVSGDSLIDKAKRSGLIPIPNSADELLKMIDPDKMLTPERIELGKMLYFDPRLSKSSKISCNWCHNLALGGVDGVSKSIGDHWNGNPNHLNSPTVYNAVFFKRQFWDGRAKSLEEQIKGPLLAPFEMASTEKLLVDRIESIPEYVKLFREAYGDGMKIDLKSIALTISLFERTLITPSRYDKFLHGDENALSEKEKIGLDTFIDKGCVICHNGVALGGDMQPFELRSKYKHRDVGGFHGNGKRLMKVPTLRNITDTAPYFHNGMIWSLRDAVKEMSNVQVAYKVEFTDEKGGRQIKVNIIPINLTDEDVDNIVAFFHSLEGVKPTIEYPQLPKYRD
ncbi:MAG: cytochrome-c peroxidase [Epsilonproteobacteria bacterium]|nr:cytochrome-c peroxidase [Campylobacterota bacterium]